MTIEEKAKAYDKVREKIAVRFGTNVAEEIFSEFEESEDERIRKGLINYFNHHKNGINIFYGIKGDDILAWLEKQESVNEIVSRCRTSWYNEGKIAGMAEGLTDDEKYQQGWHDALEKQDECHISHDDEIMIKQFTEYFTTGHGLQNTNETVVEWLNDVKEKLEKQGEQKPNPYSGTSFEYNGHTWGMCARDNGVDIICDKHIIGHLEEQGEAYTKRDVDDAWLKGMCDAKDELEKQSDSLIKWNKNTKDCKPKVSHSVLMKTTHGIAEGEWQGEHWHQYRWAALVRDSDVLSWIELSDLEKQGEQKVNYTTLVETGNGGINALITGEVSNIGYVEQKPTWTAEDERKIQDCIDAVSHVNLFKVYYQNELVEWLKSLRPQNNITDEELAKAKKDAYNEALDKIEYHSGEPTFEDGWSAAIWYLKKRNTQPQNRWKPSDEQIRPLEYAIDYFKKKNNDTVYLESLYNDLKKLREDKL